MLAVSMLRLRGIGHADPRSVSGCVVCPRYALISQKALVEMTVHQSTAFLTGHIIRGCFGHRDFVFCSAIACVHSGQPFHEFCHAGEYAPRLTPFASALFMVPQGGRMKRSRSCGQQP
jgi:hypothetical protein